jgi:hypothetical protein
MLRFLTTRTALAVAGAFALVSPAVAQYYPIGGWYRSGPAAGYTVRAWGVYGGPGLPPGPGGYEAYYPGRPIVTVADPWGRVADVPLRPKVLYYSDQFLTPHGSFYPTSIVVIPNDRRPRTVTPAPSASSTPPPVSREAIPAPKVERPAAREGAPPPKAQPPSGSLPPPPPAPARTAPLPPVPPVSDRPPKAMPPDPIPKATDPDRPAPPAAPVASDRPRSSDVPAVPALPRLPDVPAKPGPAQPATDRVPNLGPSPTDAPPPPRPGK